MGIDKSETEVLKENDNYVIQKLRILKTKWIIWKSGEPLTPAIIL